jgi:hypothetical protein
VDAVVKALAERDHVKLQPFGGYAANLLRLSEQVPARLVFLTDGKSRKVQYGKQTLELRQASPRMMAGAGRITGLVIAGLRYVGKENITPERVQHLRKLLSPGDRRQLMKDITLAPAWMHPCIRAIAGGEESLPALRRDYAAMEPMFLSPPPDFDSMLATLREAEDSINHTPSASE